MAQEKDLMSTMKRLKRVDKEGGSMSSEERLFFEEAKQKSQKFESQARSTIKTSESTDKYLIKS